MSRTKSLLGDVDLILVLKCPKNDRKWSKVVVSDHYLKKYSHNPIQTCGVPLLCECSEMTRFWATLAKFRPSCDHKMTENGGFRPLSEKVSLWGIELLDLFQIWCTHWLARSSQMLPFFAAWWPSLYFHSLWLGASGGDVHSLMPCFFIINNAEKLNFRANLSVVIHWPFVIHAINLKIAYLAWHIYFVQVPVNYCGYIIHMDQYIPGFTQNPALAKLALKIFNLQIWKDTSRLLVWV